MPVQTNTSNARSTAVKDKRQRTSAGELPSPTGVQLYVRLWSGENGEEPRVPAPARDMIFDLLSISGCVTRDDGPGSYSANFQDAVQAVKAARHLQRMVRGFCSGSERGCLNGCVTLSNAEEPAPGLDLPLLRETQVLQPAQPGQILLVGALCESARLIPGLQFHPLSGGVVAPDRSGGPREVLHLLPPVGAEDALDKPIQFRVTSTGSRRRVTTAEIVAQSVAQAAGQAASQAAGQAAAQAPGKPVSAEAPSLAHRKADAAVKTAYDTDEEEQEEPKKKPTLWIALGGVAAALIVGAVVLLMPSHKAAVPAAPVAVPVAAPAAVVETPAAVPAPVIPAAVAPAPVPVAPPPVPVAPPPVPVAPPPVAVRVAPPPAAAVPGAEPALTKKQLKAQQLAEEKAKKKADAEAEPKTAGGSLINSADISYLLAKAEKDSGDGKYDRAILEFKTVLKYQPTNAAAKEGLARANRNQNSQ